MRKEYDFTAGARRLEHVVPSSIRAITDRAAEIRSTGVSVASFSNGEPNFNTPEDIKKETIKALEENWTHYISNRGYPELREKLQEYIKWETGAAYDAQTDIIVTCGAAEALENVMMSFVDEGDEVIVLTPAFVSYKNLVHLCGAEFVEVPLDAKNNFQIDLEAVKAAITEKTKLLMINNPSNPTGAVFSRESLQTLCDLAKAHNFLILSDEVYSRLVYDGRKFYSIASFEGMKERSFIVSGFSKTFAMTGWRLGYIATNKAFADRIMRTHQYTTTCLPAFSQVGVARGMDTEHTKEEVEGMLAAFAARRKMVMDGLDQIEGLSYIKPYGAFYIMINTEALGVTGKEFVNKLLEDKHVATVPAAGMGNGCEYFVRLSYATDEKSIEEGLRGIAQLAAELRDAGKQATPVS